MRTNCRLKITYCYGLRTWITGQTVDWCWSNFTIRTPLLTGTWRPLGRIHSLRPCSLVGHPWSCRRRRSRRLDQLGVEQAKYKSKNLVDVDRCNELKTEHHWQPLILPLRCCRQKQGGVWRDHWSSCCNVRSVCWMVWRHPVAYWSLTGHLFGTLEAASIKWEIIIAILHCLSDCVFAYYARSCVKSCRRLWNREKNAGDGTRGNAMRLCIYVLPVPPVSVPCTCRFACHVDVTRDKFDNWWYILKIGYQLEIVNRLTGYRFHKPICDRPLCSGAPETVTSTSMLYGPPRGV